MTGSSGHGALSARREAMAKCLQKRSDPAQVTRVEDAKAAELVATGEWKYISKDEYKYKRISKGQDVLPANEGL